MQLHILGLAGANRDIRATILVFFAEFGISPEAVVHFLPGKEFVLAWT